MQRISTLDEFIIKSQKKYTNSTGQLTRLLRDIGIAAKIVNREVNRAGLVNILGTANQENPSGECVQKLDIFADNVFIDCLKNSGECGAILSEEQEEIIHLEPVASKTQDYVVVMDPLDGSSNIDVNVSIGTIFGIYKRVSDMSMPCTIEDFQQKGENLVAAGYILYGSSTMLVYTTGNGVYGFTLDPSIGEFCLSHRNMEIPLHGNYYSVNQGYYHQFFPEIKSYIDKCSNNDLSLRYIGSMVSDLHRTLIRGGIFLYPNSYKSPKGKLRLVYECNPMAFIIENAGGIAIDTSMNSILQLPISENLHQRSSIVMGSKSMVDDLKQSFIAHNKIANN